MTYRFEYQQKFSLPGGGELTVQLSQLDYRVREDEEVQLTRVLTDDLFVDDLRTFFRTVR